MILPIVAYGDPVLKRVADEIDEDYPNLKELIANMFETMYNANGVGLAAPQVGLGIRLFVVDAAPFGEVEEGEEYSKEELEEMEQLKTFKKVFINPIILKEEGHEWAFTEGCLSIPQIREDVYRNDTITIEYYDENWELKEEQFSGYAARVIQHEYDHIEGILFTDHLNSIKRKFLKKKLNDISTGKVRVDYRMRFPNLKR